MKNQTTITRVLVKLLFLLPLFFFLHCSAVPTADRYGQNNKDKEDVSTDSDKQSGETLTPGNTSPFFNADEIFSEAPPQFVRIPEKNEKVQPEGTYWYRFEEADENSEMLYEADGYSVSFYTTDSPETADSIMMSLKAKTGMDDIYFESANNKHFLYYGKYKDFATAAEAAIKLHQFGFRETVPVLKQLLFSGRK